MDRQLLYDKFGFENIRKIDTDIYLVKFYDWYVKKYVTRLEIWDDKYYLIGGCEINKIDFEIRDLFIEKEYRQKGYATKLINIAINKFGMKKIKVAPDNTVAFNMYIKLGFKQYRKSNDLIYMKL